MRLQLTQRVERTHRTVFMERYDWLLSWALKLTRGDHAEAEDILHDAYVQFLRLAPVLEDIENLDAYLNRMIRNLHLSRIMRRSRVPMVHIDALDYDSANLSVAAVDPFQAQPMERQLLAICEWACTRRVKTRCASVLLLRHFLDYLPTEIAAVCRCSRQVVEKSLQLARHEIRGERAAGNGGDRSAQRAPHEMGSPSWSAGENLSLEAVLYRRIFEEPSGSCLALTEMSGLYEETEHIETRVLAHLTSCAACLDRVNALLGLPLLAERSMFEGRRGGPPASGGGKTPPRLLPRGERSLRRIREHRPAQLTLQIDAGRRASVAVKAAENRLEMEAGRSGTVGFLEVFSDQGVQLLHLPLLSPAEGGDWIQETELELSEDRRLHLAMCFTLPRPTVTLTYLDPHIDELRSVALEPVEDAAGVYATPERAPIFQASPAEAHLWDRIRGSVSMLLLSPFRSVPRFVSFATSLAIVAALLFWQTRETTMQAETLLARAESWQRSSAGGAQSVLHRSFDYYEVPIGANSRLSQVVHRRVETWRQPASGRRFSRLLDDSGKPIANSSAPLMSRPGLADAWRFDPSTDTLRLLAADKSAKVVPTALGFELRTLDARLVLDRATFRPARAQFHFADREIEFTERSTESEPLASSPLAEAAAAAPEPPPAPASAPVDLDDAELRVRDRLHTLQADLGEDIHIQRGSHAVVVSGIVGEEPRRRELISALGQLPGVSVRLRSPEEAATRPSGEAARVVDATVELDAVPLLESWLTAHYLDETERSRQVRHVLDLSDGCLSRAHALDQLSRRYGAAPDAKVLALTADHARKLNADARELDRWLAAASPDGAPSDESAASASGSPAETPERLVHATRDLDKDLADLLTIHALGHGAEQPQAAALIARCRRSLREIEALSEPLR